MTEPLAAPLRRWRTGMHPHAEGMRISSLGRVHLRLGEALRIELTSDAADDDDVDLQYYIATELGPWAVWLSCPRSELADAEAALQDVTPPFPEARQA